MPAQPPNKDGKRHWPRVLDLAPWWLTIIGLLALMVLASMFGPDPAPYARPL